MDFNYSRFKQNASNISHIVTETYEVPLENSMLHERNLKTCNNILPQVQDCNEFLGDGHVPMFVNC